MGTQQSPSSIPAIPRHVDVASTTFPPGLLRNAFPHIVRSFQTGLISRRLLDILGLDLSFLVFISVAGFILQQVPTMKEGAFSLVDLLISHFGNRYEFTNKNKVCSSFAAWADERGIGLNSRTVRVEAHDTNFEQSTALNSFDGPSSIMICSMVPQLSESATPGVHWFWHKRRLFCYQKSLKEGGKGEPSTIKSSVSCLSLSRKPLKDLFDEVLLERYNSTKSLTSVWMSESGRHWICINERQSRSIQTVVLEQSLKSKLLKDMSDFLKDSTARWYAQRGLPYRRGYLFCGPPGTGKSSFAFAIAGLFKLNIYTIQLAEGDLSDSGLASLFSALPPKCIVVMEDIDNAGIKNRANGVKAVKSLVSEEGSRLRMSNDSSPQNNVTLSGLLNVIDGIGSKESRILIMTTNAFEALDPALIRPGRIDMTVQFGLSTSKAAGKIFDLMYQEPSLINNTTSVLHNEEVSELGLRFAAHIPEKQLSAAEIQGYLLLHKHDPQEAMAGVQEWVTDIVAEKQGTKVNPEKHELGEIQQKSADEVVVAKV